MKETEKPATRKAALCGGSGEGRKKSGIILKWRDQVGRVKRGEYRR